MMIVVFVNILKLAESERMVVLNPDIDPAKVDAQTPATVLFDGITTYHFKRGDMPANMFGRIEQALLTTPFLLRVWTTILGRLKESNNLLSRLASYHESGHFFERQA